MRVAEVTTPWLWASTMARFTPSARPKSSALTIKRRTRQSSSRKHLAISTQQLALGHGGLLRFLRLDGQVPSANSLTYTAKVDSRSSLIVAGSPVSPRRRGG